MTSKAGPLPMMSTVFLADRKVAIWLLVCCVMLAVMVLLGGLTRLTHSGLSIVEWQPVAGALPPLSDADWSDLFTKYQQSPEYRQINLGMALEDFKGIFWLEYVHRLWGRAIGLVFAVPFLWLVSSGCISRAMVPRLLGLFLIGALQGAMGWFMVKSGLVSDPAVSHYRLAAHLALAFLIHGWMLWLALDVLAANRIVQPFSVPAGGTVKALAGIAGLAAVTLVFGALVAGLHAGLIYNTFPLMEGRLIPADLLRLGWLSPFEDVKTVQFTHRVLALLTLAAVLAGAAAARRRLASQLPVAVLVMAGTAVLQVSLGVATL
ncbi:MAG TPA: COX15/CtaA family protein, partial [Rhodospirillaceae bacterium]|nr:COX15/CtaA family protein [Rhodospirillaceae bacterium]